MSKTQLPTNFLKHTSKNLLQRFFINNFYSTLISLTRQLKPKTVLDAGCGEGFSLDKFMANNIGTRLEGVEQSRESIALGKKIFPQIKIKEGSIYNLPYKANSFDLVLCTEVLEHLETPHKAMLEIIRVSKRYLALSVPNEPFFRIANFLSGRYIKDFGNSPGHINHWTGLSFANFIKKHNLRILKTKFTFPWIIVLAGKQQY